MITININIQTFCCPKSWTFWKIDDYTNLFYHMQVLRKLCNFPMLAASYWRWAVSSKPIFGSILHLPLQKRQCQKLADRKFLLFLSGHWRVVTTSPILSLNESSMFLCEQISSWYSVQSTHQIFTLLRGWRRNIINLTQKVGNISVSN